MNFGLIRIATVISVVLVSGVCAAGQAFARDLTVTAGGSFRVVNRYGRVAIKAEASVGDKPVVARFTATSPAGVAETDLKIESGGVITVGPVDKQKRVDLMLIVPERTEISIQTTAGVIEVAGNFAFVEAVTETGTIITDIPVDDLKYQFRWTESRPRYLADFDIAEVKEKSGGRFEIKGKHQEEVSVPKPKVPVPPDEPPADNRAKTKAPKPKTISLNFTTARGIILLNVPPSEVNSDLRERPLSEAAKAIIRSGDSLLMEAIRRAAPRYFGDYTRTLPPLKREPTFAAKSAAMANPNARTKTARVRVTDLGNRAISDLSPRDFEITENGVAREIVSVERSNAPFNLVLLLDVSGSIENYVNFIRKAARNFVDTVGAQDRVSIVIFNEDVKKLSDFTTDKAKLSESLDTFDAGGGTAYYDAIAYSVSDTLRPLRGDRTAIVILTDGDDNRSFLAFDSLIGSIQESGALVYPLYVPSALIAYAASNPNADIDPLRKKYMSLTAKSEGEGERLAKISGGVYYPITQIGQIQRAYEDIVAQMRAAYDVTFRSEVGPSEAGVSPKLKIRAKRENVFTTVTSVVAAEAR